MDTRPGVFVTVILVLPLLARWLWLKFSEALTQFGFGDPSPRLAGNGNGNGHGHGGWVLVVGAASITQPVNPFITLLFSVDWIVFVIAGAIAMVFCRTTQREPLLPFIQSSQKVVS